MKIHTFRWYAALLGVLLLVACCSSTVIPVRAASSQTPVQIIYFYTDGCSECKAVEKYLETLSKAMNIQVLAKYEALDKEGAKVRSELDTLYGTPTEERGVAPTIFVGREVLLRESGIRAGLENAVRQSTPDSEAFLASSYEKARQASGDTTSEFFKAFSVLTVIGAGLLDGINPCAFATLIFFISYLIMRSKSRRNILMVGLAFAFGVFVAYLAAGTGLYQVVSRAKWFFALSKWFYLVVGTFAAVIAALSIRDAWRARHGELGDMTLQLPERNKGMIHKLIRGQAQTGFVAASAFVIAFPISLFEFMCTGQTYLPTIVLIFSQSALKQRAALLLIVYNLLFILPLVLITVIAYLGVTSDRLVAWLKTNATAVKAGTAVLFVALAGFLLVRAFTLFGVLR